MQNEYGARNLAVALCVLAGSVFAPPAAAEPTLTTLVNFNGTDGARPSGSLIADASGTLYGTTQIGGGLNRFGTVFSVSKSGVWTTLDRFNGYDGTLPNGSLIADSSGTLYGTTQASIGGTSDGVVFSIYPKPGQLINTLESFGTRSAGIFPTAGLVADASGTLYGTTSSGIGVSNGSVFSFSYQNGIQTIYSFDGSTGDTPNGGLIIDKSGTLYGTTKFGGSGGEGTVFSVSTSGAFTTLANFDGANGGLPVSSLVADEAGTFYGTTTTGGAYGDGTLFSLTKGGGLVTLASFNGKNGSDPVGNLIIDASGALYGTTASGGAYGAGTVFSFETPPGRCLLGNCPPARLTTLESFNGTNGAVPAGGLVAEASGTLYGSTYYGGAYGDGTVFSLSGTDYDVGAIGAVPEPANWALMITGIGLIGIAVRRRPVKR